MHRLRLVFAGTSDFAVPSLRALAADERFAVELVISQPDRPVGRKQLLTPPPVAACATTLGLPLAQPEQLNADLPTLQARVGTPPDFLVVVAYGQILKPAALAWPKRVPINVHGSLLPRWRGASPVHHALLQGDTRTGVSVQRMVSALDAGPVLAQAACDIEPRDTFSLLHDRLAQLGADLLVQTLADLPPETPQNEDPVTVCRTLKREDGVVDPASLTAIDIDRRIRAFTPWPGVTLPYGDTTLKLLRAELAPQADAWALPCAQGTTLYVTELQPAGKTAMSAAAWARGRGR